MSAPSRTIVHRCGALSILLLLLARCALAAPASIWVANRGNSTILRFNKTDTGNVAPETTISYVGFSRLQAIALDGGGNIWALDLTNNAVYKFTAGSSGASTPSVTISGGSTLLNQPFGMAFDPSGNLWITQFETASVNLLEFSAAQLGAGGNVAPTASTIVSAHNSLGIAFDSSGKGYLTDDIPEIIQLTGTTPNWRIVGAATLLGPFPVGVGLDSAGNIYATANTVTGAPPQNLLKFNAGACTVGTSPCNIAPNSSTGVGVNSNTFAVTVDGSGTIFVTNSAGASITSFDSSFAQLTSISGLLTTLSNPQYIALAPGSAPPGACNATTPAQNQAMGPRCR